MGAAAFVLASFIDMPYAYVAMGAAIPAFLFYLTLLVQVDGHAAKKEMKEVSGLEETPLKQVLRDGWFFIPTMAVLLYVLFIMRWTGESAYISTAVLLLLAQVNKKSRFTLKKFLTFLENTGKSLAIMGAVLAGAGMLMGSFSLTGIAATFSRELFLLAGGSIPLMLIFTAVASMILGMGMTVIACYIFLALVVAPALVSAGLNELAVHLYVLYCGMLSFITPPVALCAYAASSIAKEPPVKIALLSCRLGGAIFILPFFFVIDPALVMQGSTAQVLTAFLTASLGMLLLGSALEGYLIGIGELKEDWVGFLQRAVLAVSGITFALPGWKFDVSGLLLTIMTMIALWSSHRSKSSVTI